jgi:hypothetical protein
MTEFSLSDTRARVVFDERGRLTFLALPDGGNAIRTPRPGPWRLFLCELQDQEIPVLPEDQEPPEITVDEHEIALTYPRLRCHLGVLDIALVLRVRIENGETHWRATVDNQAGLLVSEAWYPLIGGLVDLSDRPDKQFLAWPSGAGSRIPDPRAWLRHAHSGYRGADQFEITAKLHYPYPAGMAWCDLHTDSEGLFVASLDDRFRNGCLCGMLEGDAMSLGTIKYPLIGRGQRWESPVAVVAAHQGDWRWGAHRYRRWADNWLRLPTPPPWLHTWFGWQRTILEHQYGEVLWTYDQLAQLTEHALDADLDALHILGWWKGGMDRGYPHYDCDERLGGEAAFRAGIQAAKARGLKVLPYMNGRLMDVTMPYFKTHGNEFTARTLIGTQYRETYPFWGRGSLVSTLARQQVQHAIPCPSCAEWWDEVERQVVEYGADGILIDQVGGVLDRLCFSKEHGHKRPDEAFTASSDHFLARLRRHLKADHPDFAIGSELFSDRTAQHFDFVHGCGQGFNPTGYAFPALTRYTFPEYIFTNRDGGYDEREFRRHVGFAVVHGFRFDMSVHRCRGSMHSLPNYAAYLPAIRALHRVTDHMVLTGRYTHEDHYRLDCPVLRHAGYTGADGRLAVVTWNPTDSVLPCPRPETERPLRKVYAAGGTPIAPPVVTLAPDDVVIWVFSKP